jgi:uncharacterized membrane protein YcaP (DUF421 family)
MFEMSVGAGELIVRTAAVYFFLFVAFRFISRKHVGELSPFDFLVLLIISETVQNAMVGDDKSLLGGLISAGTLVVLMQSLGYLGWRSKRAERWLDGAPTVLVRHGRRCADAMASAQVTVSELTEALRRDGCSNICDVRAAVLENDGRISVLKRSKPQAA